MTAASDQPGPEKSGPQPATAADHGQWVAVLYAELRALAQSELQAERRGHTLSATALVNEVYLKLSGSQSSSDSGSSVQVSSVQPIDRGAFFGAAAQAMRRILVDHARGKKRQKRGGGNGVLGTDALSGVADPNDGSSLDPIELDVALVRLASEHADAARVVELRFFAGLPEKTIAEVMNVNERTVRRHWTFAKAWLAREMNLYGAPPEPPSGTPRCATAPRSAPTALGGEQTGEREPSGGAGRWDGDDEAACLAVEESLAGNHGAVTRDRVG